MQHKPPLIPYESFAFVAEPPELPTRREGDTGSLEYVARAEISDENERGITLTGTTQNGEPIAASMTIVAPGVVRILLEGEERDPNRVTLAGDVSDAAVNISLERIDGRVALVSDEVTVRINLDPFHVTFYGADGRPFLDQNYTETNVADYTTVLPFGFSTVDGERSVYHDTFTTEPDEHFYGFGEKFSGLDKRGQQLEMLNYDSYGAHTERAYKNVPFFMSSRGYAIFVDSVTHINFDMAASNNATFSIVVPDTALDYYVIVGSDPKAIISRYAELVSLPILPPKWAFGLWMSSGFQRDSQEEVLRRAQSIREHGVPCDVLHLDCYWQRFGRWSEMLWDKEMFPDPEAMLSEVKAMGFKVCLWMNSYLGVESERFAEADSKGYLLKNSEGKSYVAELWGRYHPPVGIIDFTNPEASKWFEDLLRPLLRQGVDVFKTDLQLLTGHAIVCNRVGRYSLANNLYPLLYNDAVATVTAEETRRAGMVWGRSTYAGGQRHAAQWSGDPNCTYNALASTLRSGLSIGLCGHAFWSHDIGGFHRQPTPELYVRWAQFGLLSPLSRAHGMTTRLPWDYGEEALRIFRYYTHLRYRLLPYIYTYASIAAETSVPIMRPMLLEFPTDPCVHGLDLQYMFGSELLVAPIYNSQGQRPVYLPSGRWVDYWTREVIEGPRMQHVEATLDTLPLYVRADALVPTVEPQDHLSEDPFEMVTFDCYLIEEGTFELRDTDGVTRVEASFEGTRLEIGLEGAKQKIGLRLIPLRDAPQVEKVRANGSDLEKVESLRLDLNSGVGWTSDPDGAVRVVVG